MSNSIFPARYICLEGTEGVGKTTQTKKLVNHLLSKGYKVLQTKEPGTPLSPLTMELRNIMLNAKYEKEITPIARELVSQAIRNIHLLQVIKPALYEYDFIIQDRGILSGLAYGDACGNDPGLLGFLASLHSIDEKNIGPQVYKIYDDVLYLNGDVSIGLDKALTGEQEFEAGDAIEARGLDFMNDVSTKMVQYSQLFNTKTIDVHGKDIDTVFTDILNVLDISNV